MFLLIFANMYSMCMYGNQCFCAVLHKQPALISTALLLKLRITNECVPAGVRAFLCKHAFLCVSASMGAC